MMTAGAALFVLSDLMLAMDLFLPAVPTLQAALAIGVPQAQATVAVFLAGLAVSQLVWGEALNRLGPRRCVLIGMGLLVLASLGCALAPDIGWLLGLRTLQVLRRANDNLHAKTGERIDFEALPLDDRRVLQLFSEGKTVSVFQFESGGIRQALKLLSKA